MAHQDIVTSQYSHELAERLEAFVNSSDPYTSISSFLSAEGIKNDSLAANEVFNWLFGKSIKIKDQQSVSLHAFGLQMVEAGCVTRDYLRHYAGFVIPDRRKKSFLNMVSDCNSQDSVTLTCAMLKLGFDPVSPDFSPRYNGGFNYNLLDKMFRLLASDTFFKAYQEETIDFILDTHPNLTPSDEIYLPVFLEYKRMYLAKRGASHNLLQENETKAARMRF